MAGPDRPLAWAASLGTVVPRPSQVPPFPRVLSGPFFAVLEGGPSRPAHARPTVPASTAPGGDGQRAHWRVSQLHASDSQGSYDRTHPERIDRNRAEGYVRAAGKLRIENEPLGPVDQIGSAGGSSRRWKLALLKRRRLT